MNSQFTHCTGRADSSHFHCQQVPFLCIIDFASVINTWRPLLPVFLQVRAAQSFQDNSVVWAVRAFYSALEDEVFIDFGTKTFNGAEPRPCCGYGRSWSLSSETPRAVMQPLVEQKPVEQSSGMQWVNRKSDAENPAIMWKTLIAHSQIQQAIIWVNFN